MDHLEDPKWRGVQQGDVIPDGDHTQDSDVNQDLAPSGESQAGSHGWRDDKCDGDERILIMAIRDIFFVVVECFMICLSRVVTSF